MIRWILLLLGAATALAAAALRRAPGWVEAVWAQGPGPWIPWALSRAAGWIPLAVAPLLALALLAVLGRGIWMEFRGDGPALGHAVRSLGLLLGTLGALVLLFYFTWGFNYARPLLEERRHLPVDAPITAEELSEALTEAVLSASDAYRELHGSEDAGTPTVSGMGLRETTRALEVGWGRLVGEWGLPPVLARPYGPVKALGVSRVLEALGISGIYVPFTGESLVNGRPPDVAVPAVMAHEQAHQRGFAPEDEASFMGIMAGVRSSDPMVRYATWSAVLRRLSADLGRTDPDRLQAILDGVPAGIRRDWEDLARYYRERRSPLSPMTTAVNDRYLRAHGVIGGVGSYGRVTRLLVAWRRLAGGLDRPLSPGASGPGRPAVPGSPPPGSSAPGP